MEVFISNRGIPHKNNEPAPSAKRLTEGLYLLRERASILIWALLGGS